MTVSLKGGYIKSTFTAQNCTVVLFRARKPKMETLQIIQSISLIVLALAATASVIYFIFVLKEIRGTVEETKEILKNGRKLTTSVVTPLASVMGLIGGLTKGIDAIRSVTDIFNKDEEDEYEEY